MGKILLLGNNSQNLQAFSSMVFVAWQQQEPNSAMLTK